MDKTKWKREIQYHSGIPRSMMGKAREEEEIGAMKLGGIWNGKHHIECWASEVALMDEGNKVKHMMKMEVRGRAYSGKRKIKYEVN